MRSPRFEGPHACASCAWRWKPTRWPANPIDPLQLEAAMYMHDVGMMFLPESVWLKGQRMTPAEQAHACARTPTYAAGLLSRMEGWAAAAEMVAQHHETPDGKGYPAGAYGRHRSALAPSSWPLSTPSKR
jgi:hypothetical protein